MNSSKLAVAAQESKARKKGKKAILDEFAATTKYNCQNKIYRAYRLYRRGGKSRRTLTEDEKRALEINVEVKQGCTEAILSLGLNLLKELGDNMTGQEIFNCAAIVSIAWAAKSIACTAISEHFKTKRYEAAHKAEGADTEAKKQYFSSVASIMRDFDLCKRYSTRTCISCTQKH